MFSKQLISDDLLDTILNITEESTPNTLTKRQLNQIAKHTDTNFHTRAIGYAAKCLGRDDIHKACNQIEKEHIKAGGLTQDLSDRREAEWKKLNAHAKQHLSPEDYTKLHQSF